MLIGAGERRDGLYYFMGMLRVHAKKANGVVCLNLSHKRLGHPSLQVTKLVPRVNLRDKKIGLNKNCDVYQRVKQSSDKFPVSEYNAYAIFELIHCDLWGPYGTISSCGASYFFTIIDDFSRAVWIYLLVDKEVPNILKMFFSMVERQLISKLKF